MRMARRRGAPSIERRLLGRHWRCAAIEISGASSSKLPLNGVLVAALVDGDARRPRHPTACTRARALRRARDHLQNFLAEEEDTAARGGAQPKLEVIAGDALMVEVGARTPLGLNARVLPCGRPGLVFLDEVAYGGGDAAGPGDVVPAYVVQERDDGRLDLSFRPAGSLPKLVETASLLLAALYRAEADGGALALGDASSPAEIRRELGVSKATFKAARGRLLRRAPASPPRALAPHTPRPTSANLIARGSVESAGGPRATQQEQTAQRRSNPPRACFGTCPRRFAPAAHPPPRTREPRPSRPPADARPLPPSPPARLGLLQRPLPSHETALVSGAAWPASLPPPAGRGGTLHLDALPAADPAADAGAPVLATALLRLCSAHGEVCARAGFAPPTSQPRAALQSRSPTRRPPTRRARRSARRRARACATRRRRPAARPRCLWATSPTTRATTTCGMCSATAATSRRWRSSAVSVATRAASAASRSSPPTVPPPPSASRARRSAARASASSRLSARRRRRRCRPPPPVTAAAAWGGRQSPAVEATLDRWVAAKRARDYETADALRAELEAAGVRPEDARPRKGPPRVAAGGRSLIRGAARRAERREGAPRRGLRGRRVGRRRAALAQEWGRVGVHALHIV